MRNWGLKNRSKVRSKAGKINTDERLSHGLVYIYVCTKLDSFHNAMETGSLNNALACFSQGQKVIEYSMPDILYFHNLDKLISLSSCLLRTLAVARSAGGGSSALIKKNRGYGELYRNLPALREFVALGERTFLLQCTHPSARRQSTHSFSPQSS